MWFLKTVYKSLFKIRWPRYKQQSKGGKEGREREPSAWTWVPSLAFPGVLWEHQGIEAARASVRTSATFKAVSWFPRSDLWMEPQRKFSKAGAPSLESGEVVLCNRSCLRRLETIKVNCPAPVWYSGHMAGKLFLFPRVLCKLWATVAQPCQSRLTKNDKGKWILIGGSLHSHITLGTCILGGGGCWSQMWVQEIGHRMEMAWLRRLDRALWV